MADIGFKLLGDASNFTAMIDRSHNMVTKFGQAMNLFGVGIGAAGLIGFFKNIVDKVGAIQDLSDRLGVGTDALQSFDYQVRLAGGSSEQAVQAWDKGRKALDNLAAGNEAAVKQFRALGLSAKDFIGLNLEESLEVIASGYTENVSAAGAYDAITDILGAKSAPALMAALTALGTEGFGAFIKGAKDAGQLIEGETIKKIDAFGDRLTTLKGSLQGFGASVLNLFLALGEDIGEMVAHQFNLWDGIETVQLSAIDSADKAVKAMDKMTPALEAQIDYEAKIAKIKEQQDAIADKALSRQDRISKLTAEAFALQVEMFNLGLSEGERNELNLKRLGVITKIKGEVGELDKEAEKIAQARDDFLNKEVERMRELLPIDQQRTDLLGQISTLEDGIRINKEKGLETLGMEKDLADARHELRKVEAEIIDENVASEKEKLAVMKEETTEIVEQNKKLEIQNTITRRGKGYEQQSDESLEGVRNRLQDQIEAADRERFGKIVGVGGKSKSFEQSLLEGELFNINKEIQERDKIRDYSSRFGEQRARQQFGDTLTDKALRDWTDLAQRQTTAQEDIAARLQALFPKK